MPIKGGSSTKKQLGGRRSKTRRSKTRRNKRKVKTVRTLNKAGVGQFNLSNNSSLPFGSTNILIADYIFRQDEADFPEYFKLALQYKLAAIFAGSVARDAQMIQQFETLGENQMRIAKNIDSQEVSNSVLNTKRFIQDRLTTGGY